jgi:energy-coupling factor transport system ATP-binding protein
LEQIDRYRKQNNATVLLVSHRMEDVAHIADKVLVMQKGSRVMLDTPDKVFSQADLLAQMGLTVPAVTRVLSLLREKGIVLPENAYTVPDAAALLTAFLQEKGVGRC